MRRSYNHHRGDSKSSIDEYIERVTRMQHMPSVLADYPEETRRHDDHHQIKIMPVSHDDRQHRALSEMHKRARDTHKKVYFTEHENAIEIGRDEKRDVAYVEKGIDVEADGYIQQKHKSFEMCKYDTFKAY